MKKLLLVALVLIPAFAVSALDFGVGFDVSLNMETWKDGASKASDTDLELMPAVVLLFPPRVEVRPYLVYGFNKEWDPDNIEAGAPAAELCQPYLGVGGGLYYRFIGKEWFNLLVGPKLEMLLYLKESGASATPYNSYFHTAVTLSLPVYVDVRLTDSLYLRAGIEIPGLYLDHVSLDETGTKEANTVFGFTDYQSGFTPYFGFYYVFKRR